MIANLITIASIRSGAAPTPPPPPGPTEINSWAEQSYRLQTNSPVSTKYNLTLL